MQPITLAKKALLLASTFMLASCTDDNYLYKTRMQGQWQVKNITINHYINNKLTSTAYQTNFGANDKLEFNKDGTGYMSLVAEPYNEPLGTMNYTVSGQDKNEVNATNGRATLKFRIISVDEPSMRIIYKQNDKSTSTATGSYDEYDVNVARQ